MATRGLRLACPGLLRLPQQSNLTLGLPIAGTMVSKQYSESYIEDVMVRERWHRERGGDGERVEAPSSGNLWF